MERKILGISPGVNFIGYALLYDCDLVDWGTKTIKGKWTEKKRQKIARIFQDLVDWNAPDCLALKKIDPSRSSPELAKRISRLKELCRERKIPVFEYPVKYLRNHFVPPDEKETTR